MKKFAYIFIIILLLVSCSPSTELPVTIYTSISPLPSTATSIPASTKTLVTIPVTQTATILVTSTPSQTLTVTPPNFNSFLTASAIRGACWGAQDVHYEDLSPDGNWFAVMCQPNDPSEFYGTKIVNLNSDVVWDVPFYETYGIFQKNAAPPDGIRKGQMQVAHWTNDGNYVYLEPYFCCADSPQNIFFSFFADTPALYRLDLRTGKLTVTLQPFIDDIFADYYTSFSPNDAYLVYVIPSSPREINFYDLQTGNTFTITVDEKYIASGRFSWSPDGNMAIFIAVKSEWSYGQNPTKDGVSYFLMDLKERKSIRLFDKEDIYEVSWTQDGNIILHEVSGKDGLLYNFQNNEFIPVTATPRP